MSLLDALLGVKRVLKDGVEQAFYQTFNFVGNWTIAPDAINKRLDITAPPSGTASLLGLHTPIASTVAHWTLDETLNDATASPANLTSTTADPRWMSFAPDKYGAFCIEGHGYQSGEGITKLAITGDMGLVLQLLPIPHGSGPYVTQNIVGYYGGGGNAAYALSYNSDGRLGWFQGTADTHTVNYLPAIGVVTEVGVTRTSGVVQFYVNGKPVGSPSGAFSAPSGISGTARLFLGVTTHYFAARSLVICDGAVTAPQMLTFYNEGVGLAQGALA